VLNRLLLGLTIVLACGVLVAQAFAATSRTVGLRDNFITVSSSSAPHGSVTFSVTNRGLHTHNFNIQRVSSGNILFASRNLGPGGHITVTRTLKAGSYRLFCSIHAGMQKTFTVT
jgi:cupredoxin-like protein